MGREHNICGKNPKSHNHYFLYISQNNKFLNTLTLPNFKLECLKDTSMYNTSLTSILKMDKFISGSRPSL